MTIFSFYCFGHKNILATHKSTIEITKDSTLTLKGDCIVGVRSTHGLKDLPPELKEKIRSKNATIQLILKVNNLTEIITGKGNPELKLSHKEDIVVRKSNYICPRTLMIKADKAAKDLSREFINSIKNEKTRIQVFIIVK